MRLEILLSSPVSRELIEQIQRIPSVLEVKAAGDTRIFAELEESADVEETAYLIESLPGVLEVLD